MCVCEQRFAGFELLETEFQLRDALIELFGGASKVQTAQPRQLHFELAISTWRVRSSARCSRMSCFRLSTSSGRLGGACTSLVYAYAVTLSLTSTHSSCKLRLPGALRMTPVDAL